MTTHHRGFYWAVGVLGITIWGFLYSFLLVNGQGDIKLRFAIGALILVLLLKTYASLLPLFDIERSEYTVAGFDFVAGGVILGLFTGIVAVCSLFSGGLLITMWNHFTTPIREDRQGRLRSWWTWGIYAGALVIIVLGLVEILQGDNNGW